MLKIKANITMKSYDEFNTGVCTGCSRKIVFFFHLTATPSLRIGEQIYSRETFVYTHTCWLAIFCTQPIASKCRWVEVAIFWNFLEKNTVFVNTLYFVIYDEGDLCSFKKTWKLFFRSFFTSGVWFKGTTIKINSFCRLDSECWKPYYSYSSHISSLQVSISITGY